MNMRRYFSHARRLPSLLLLMFFSGAGLAGPTEAAKDIRVLIDISGSMKHNDPHNLRAPALRLLTGLLPNGVHAGVWTYGQQVNMLVPHGTVDAAWKARAEQAGAKINSAGLYTNIEDALRKASADWLKPDAGAERHIIMLTDGLVDVSKDKSVNAAARERITNDLVPMLRDAKVQIHTIALSAEADQALLRQLAAATGGTFEQVDNADTLQKVFLRMFEQAAKPDALPLKDNSVRVDPSIEEMTFLAFHNADQPIELITPGKQIWSAAQIPAAVHWHRDTGFDLITITKPAAGEWHIRGTQDKDNRVLVVTNLKVRATSLPTNLAVDDLPYYFVQLTQQGTVIRDADFLKLVKIAMRFGEDTAALAPLHDDGKAPDISAGDGTFSYRFAALKQGRHEITLVVDGTTFQRELRQVLNVYVQPAAATVQPDPAGGGRYVLAVVPHAGLIDTQTMQVTAVVTKPDGTATPLVLAQSGPAEWRQEVVVGDAHGQYTAAFTVQGMRPDGKPINQALGKISFGAGGIAVVPAPEPVKAEPVVAPPPAPAAPATEEAPTSEAPAQPTKDTKVNWITVAWQVVTFNLALAVIGFFVYKRWRRGRTPAVSLPGAEGDT